MACVNRSLGPVLTLLRALCRLCEWNRRMRDGTETASWLNANTKPCPKCTKPVEKAGGCNLVVCRCGQVGAGVAQGQTSSFKVNLVVRVCLWPMPCVRWW